MTSVADFVYAEPTFSAITESICGDYTGDITGSLCTLYEYCYDETVCSCTATMGNNQCQTCSPCFTSDGQTFANFDCTNIPGGELFLSTDCNGRVNSFTESCNNATAVPTETPPDNEYNFCQVMESLSSGDDDFYQDHPCTCEVNEDGSYNVTCVAKNEKCCGNVCSRVTYQSDKAYDGETVLSDGETQCTRYSGDMDAAFCIDFSHCSPDSESICSCRATLDDTTCLSCSVCPSTDPNVNDVFTTLDCTNVPGGDLFLVSECGIFDPILDTCSDAATSSTGSSATSTSAASNSAPSKKTTSTKNEKDAAVSNLSKHVLAMLSLATLVIIYT
jgi:hypothetical protein